MSRAAEVTEMRLVVTTDDYARALHFYRDVLGLREAGAQLIAAPTTTPWGSSNARLAGRAGLQLTLFSGDDV